MQITRVEGRHPADPRPLKSENVTATVVCDGTTARVRLDDAANPEFWLEITVDLRQTVRDILERN